VIKIREEPSLPDFDILLAHAQLNSHIVEERAFGPGRSLRRYGVSLKPGYLSSLQRHIHRDSGTQI
jgi:hypothetical protein